MLVSQGSLSSKDGIDVKLVGTQSLNVSDDKIHFEVDVGTNWGRIGSKREF